MAHVLVEQLRFTRSHWQRGLADVTAGEALQRHGRINSISWMIGHLASHEQYLWFLEGQQQPGPAPQVHACGYGQPASAPPLDEMWDAWQRITRESDPWLDSLTAAQMEAYLPGDREQVENIGSSLLHVIYHYWYHLGEVMAARQLLAGDSQHPLPEFPGPLVGAPWRAPD